MTEQLVGRSVQRKEGREKVTGQSKYVDDLSFPDMLYGATVRSSIPRGRIRQITFGEGIPWDEFTIVTAKDIPGANYVALFVEDQPFLASETINHPEEPVLLLAHHDKYLLEKARRSITIDVEPFTPIFSIADSLNKAEIIWGADNVFKRYLVEKGNVDEVWDKADFIIEGAYETGAQEQL
ncbi:MAG TPA: carbon monoxide dehydrogenase, partial [Blastocatellia bacterium]|nr:carbon monoxide dehydrogenase [Blastocatellia bacterium]